MTMAETNVAQFPESGRPTANVTYDDVYLEFVFHRNGWSELADILSTHPGLTPGMQNFCRSIMRLKKRPSVKQLALLMSLDVNCGAQKRFAEMEAAERTVPKRASAHVIQLKRKR
jgi:hypothetical protein